MYILYRNITIRFVFILMWMHASVGAAQSPNQVHRESPMMRIYFVPFAMETYEPITMNEIEKRSIYILWFTKDHPFIPKLRRTLQTSGLKKSIDDRVIRLKAIIDEDIFFVDKDGTVFHKNSGKGSIINKRQLDEIEREFLKRSGVVDINAAKILGVIK